MPIQLPISISTLTTATLHSTRTIHRPITHDTHHPPLQFYDLAFLYVFFSLRTFVEGTSATWVVQVHQLTRRASLTSLPPPPLATAATFVTSVPLQVILLQINLIARNSGTNWGIFLMVVRPILRAFGKTNPLDTIDTDPVIKLQFIARTAIQYDIADM